MLIRKMVLNQNIKKAGYPAAGKYSDSLLVLEYQSLKNQNKFVIGVADKECPPIVKLKATL